MLVSAAARLLPPWAGRGKTAPSWRHQQDMTPHKTQAAPGCSSGPPVDVQTWRRCRLLEAGFPAAVADAVASDGRFDLHALLQLVDRGCPPELAVRIVAPLPREVAP
jgi:hypothetical protein